MKKKTKDKIEILLDTVIDDMLLNADMAEQQIKAIGRKGKLLQWGTASIAEQQIGILNKLKKGTSEAIKGGVQSAGVLGDMYEEADGDFEAKFTWQATGGNICPKCQELHGQTETMDYWVSHGLPGSADTYCGGHCVCILVKEEITKKNSIIIKKSKDGKEITSIHEKIT